MSTTFQDSQRINKTTKRLSDLTLKSTSNVLECFACTLSDEQLARMFREAAITEQALRQEAHRKGSSATLEKMIAEQEFIYFLTSDILMRRGVSMGAVHDGDI